MHSDYIRALSFKHASVSLRYSASFLVYSFLPRDATSYTDINLSALPYGLCCSTTNVSVGEYSHNCRIESDESIRIDFMA